MTLLEVRDLVVDIGGVRVLDGISFDVADGEVLGVVGESGSGKSVTALAIMGLLPPTARVSGEVRFRGTDLLTTPERELRRLRGRDVAMVFQDPMTAMNPVHTVGGQIAEMLRLHGPRAPRATVRERVVGLLESVRVPDPAARASAYPHQFSGGMLQRSVIAMGMAHAPALLIADEPTTALDVTVQAQVLDVLREQRETTGSAMILVSHDLGVIAAQADRMAVMYSGRLVEQGPVADVFDAPAHPYTAGLLAALLDVHGPRRRAYAIPGAPPSPAERPEGCAFRPRCGLYGGAVDNDGAVDGGRAACREPLPVLALTGRSACAFPAEVPGWAERRVALGGAR